MSLVYKHQTSVFVTEYRSTRVYLIYKYNGLRKVNKVMNCDCEGHNESKTIAPMSLEDRHLFQNRKHGLSKLVGTSQHYYYFEQKSHRFPDRLIVSVFQMS